MKQLRLLLFPFSLLYAAILWIRRKAFEQGILPAYQSPVPVISIGNLSTGGTGKTPLAEYILGILLKQGRNPAYLSRGYGRQSQGYLQVIPDQHTFREVGDEALQVARKFPSLPVAVCEQRKVGIQLLTQQHQLDVIILDDAFQHLKVNRDLDIVTIDAARLPTRDWVLPAGNLRESRQTLKKADLLIINKVQEREQIPSIRNKLAPFGLPMAFSQAGITHFCHFNSGIIPLSKLNKAPVVLFSGLGNNQTFKKTVEKIGIEVKDELFFPDHHPYHKKDLQKIVDMASSFSDEACWIATTEKDRMRLLHSDLLSDIDLSRWIYFPLEIEWLEGRETLMNYIKSAIT